MVCRTFGEILLVLHLYWYSMDYPNLVCLVCISDTRILCLWNHCPTKPVISYWPLAQMNSLILSIKSPVLLSFSINYYCSYFYHCHFSTVRSVKPCLLPTRLLQFFPLSCNLDIYAPVSRNSSTFLIFAKTRMEWNFSNIYPPFSCFLLVVFYIFSYSCWCQIYYW